MMLLMQACSFDAPMRNINHLGEDKSAIDRNLQNTALKGG
jgi:hypothetical protein